MTMVDDRNGMLRWSATHYIRICLGMPCKRPKITPKLRVHVSPLDGTIVVLAKRSLRVIQIPLAADAALTAVPAVQAYLVDCASRLIDDLERANREGYKFGCKLVRVC